MFHLKSKNFLKPFLNLFRQNVKFFSFNRFDFEEKFKSLVHHRELTKAKALINNSFEEEGFDLNLLKNKCEELAENLSINNRKQEISELYQSIVKTLSNPKSFEEYKFLMEANLNLAVQSELTGDYQKSIERVERNIEITEQRLKDLCGAENINERAFLCINLYNLSYIKVRQSKDNQELAQGLLDRAMQIYSSEIKPNLNKLEESQITELAKMFTNLKNQAEAISILKILIESADIDTKARLNSFISISDMYITLQDPDNALTYLEQYENQVMKRSDFELNELKGIFFSIARSYESVAQGYSLKHKPEQSQQLTEKSTHYYEKFSDNKIYRIVTYLIKANNAESLGDFEQGIKYSQKFINVVKEFQSKIYDEQGNFLHVEDAQRFSNRILPYTDQIFYIVSSQYLIASCQYNLKKIDESREFYTLSSHFLTQIQDKLLQEQSYAKVVVDMKGKIGIGNLQTKNFEEAVQNFNFVIKNSKSQDEALNAIFNKAVAYYNLEEYNRSKEAFSEMFNYLQDHGIRLKEEKMKDVYNLLVKVNEKRTKV